MKNIPANRQALPTEDGDQGQAVPLRHLPQAEPTAGVGQHHPDDRSPDDKKNFLPRGIACHSLVCATRDSLPESGDIESGQVNVDVGIHGQAVEYNRVSGKICVWTQSDLKSE